MLRLQPLDGSSALLIVNSLYLWGGELPEGCQTFSPLATWSRASECVCVREGVCVSYTDDSLSLLKPLDVMLLTLWLNTICGG